MNTKRMETRYCIRKRSTNLLRHEFFGTYIVILVNMSCRQANVIKACTARVDPTPLGIIIKTRAGIRRIEYNSPCLALLIPSGTSSQRILPPRGREVPRKISHCYRNQVRGNAFVFLDPLSQFAYPCTRYKVQTYCVSFPYCVY